MRRSVIAALGLLSVTFATLGVLTRCGAAGVRATGTSPLLVHETLTGAAGDEARPLLVALHGRGDTHERFATVFAALRTHARVVSIGAPVVESDGRAWFTFNRGWGGAVDDLDACLPRILSTIEAETARVPTRGRPVVVGFSQGAMLAYMLALRHPSAIAAAFPVSGVSVESLEPVSLDADAIPPIHAFHGAADEIISIGDGRETVEHLRARGLRVELTEVPDATHWIGTSVATRLLPALDEALEAQRSAP